MKINKIRIALIAFAFAIFSIGCTYKSNEAVKEAATIEVATEIKDSSEEIINEVVEDIIESRYHYDEDFERFKQAVIDKDLRGIGAFANSDEIDAEDIIMFFSDPDFLDQLKATTFADLKVVENNGEINLEFSATVSGSDDEGNEYESGVFLYFIQGEPNLKLEYYLAAG